VVWVGLLVLAVLMPLAELSPKLAAIAFIPSLRRNLLPSIVLQRLRQWIFFVLLAVVLVAQATTLVAAAQAV
jgi:predicted Abi (CAAX) family protease